MAHPIILTLSVAVKVGGKRNTIGGHNQISVGGHTSASVLARSGN